MDFINFSDWVKPRAWRKLAEEHTDKSGKEYVVIGYESDDKDERFELLRLSRYSVKFDANKLALHTPIRAFDGMTVQMSRRTRDLGLTRFITDKGKPIFVLEPGPDVLKWMAIREGVAEMELVNIARRGEVGRAVRRKDRRALKASQQQAEATIQAHDEDIHELESKLAQAKVDRDRAIHDRDNAKYAHDRMVENQTRENERNGQAPGNSGSMASPLGRAEEQGFKPVTNKPLPGSYGG